jgi:hypothetical protein
MRFLHSKVVDIFGNGSQLLDFVVGLRSLFAPPIGIHTTFFLICLRHILGVADVMTSLDFRDDGRPEAGSANT